MKNPSHTSYGISMRIAPTRKETLGKSISCSSQNIVGYIDRGAQTPRHCYTPRMQKADIQKKIADIESAMAAPDFWADKDKAQTALKEYHDLKAALAGNAGYDKSDVI